MIFFEYAIFLIVKVRAAQAFILRHILGCASSVRAAQAFILRHILGCASSPTFLRSTFAQPSLGRILDFGLACGKINH